MAKVLIFLVLLGLAQTWVNAQRPDGLPEPGFGQGNAQNAVQVGQDQGGGQGQGQGQGQGAQGRGAVIPGQYIVVFKQTGEPVASVAERVRGQRPDAIEVFEQYEAALRGCAIRLRNTPDLPDEASRSALVNSIQANLADSIEYVEADQVVTTSQVGTLSLNSGVNRIRGSVGTSYKSAAMSLDAAKVGIAIVDTGVLATHADLKVSANGFCASGLSFDCGNPRRTNIFTDCNGHGTHCAGIAAGSKTGVAPNTIIYPVKVLSKGGSGQVSGIVSGLDWIAQRVVSNDVNPPIRVASMSLGGGVSTSLDTAVTNLANTGVVVVVAAGNSNADLANTSPARASGAITVTALTMQTTADGKPNDIPASYSNYASGAPDNVLAAPGTNIYSTWSDGRYNTISGTSMATPHVAGMVARCFGFSYTCTSTGSSKLTTTGYCNIGATGLTSRNTFLSIMNTAYNKYTDSSDGYTGQPTVVGGTVQSSSRYYGWLGFAPWVDSQGPSC